MWLTEPLRQVSRVHVVPSANAVEGAVELVDPKTGRRHVVRFPRADIDASIRFSFWGCVVSVVGFALVLTDIPRTGLSLSLAACYDSVAPSVYPSYGPYAYPGIHINQTTSKTTNTSTFTGTRDDELTEAASVWAYKFDTLSISQRAIAEHLNVASYPDCILYRSACPSPTLSLTTTFAMIDGWISAMQTRYFSPNTTDRDLPFVFMTRSNWLDRLQQVLLKAVWMPYVTRVNAVHFHAWEAINSTRHPRSLCGLPASPHHRRVRRADFCDFPLRWRIDPPFPLVAPPVTIPRHMELHLAALRSQYPNLELELMVLTARDILTGPQSFTKVPIASYSSETMEITMWTRGRRCQIDANGSSLCEVVFVDDYRYEWGTITSNAEDWRRVTGFLRGMAQTYIWLRFLCLCGSTYHARSSENMLRHRSVAIRLLATIATLSKIPSHIVVYGSWLPVVCYSAAHMIDSGPMHLVSSNVWGSFEGFFQFNLVSFVRSASAQMRNVWVVALVWKTALFLATRTNGNAHGHAWRPHDGLVAMRGISVSFISWVTIFSFLRALRFRDANVVAFVVLPRHMPFNDLRFPPSYNYPAEFGYRLDIKTAGAATLLVLLYGLLLQRLVAWVTKQPTRFFFCRTYYIPHSAGRLWPSAMLHLFWFLTMVKTKPPSPRSPPSPPPHPTRLHRSSNWGVVVERTLLPRVPNRHVDCSVCNRPQSLIHWKSVQGCVRHDHLFRVDTRPPEVWAMVRLLNLALLSDPLALARVYLWGRNLYVYATKLDSDERKVDSLSVCRSGYLLPATLEELGDANRSAQLELLMVVNSKTLPWGVLVSCG
jgi:hypothetical protein